MRAKAKLNHFKPSPSRATKKTVFCSNFSKCEDQRIQERSIKFAERALMPKSINRKYMSNAEYLSKRKIDTILFAHKRRVSKQCTVEVGLKMAPIYGKVSQSSLMSYHALACKATKLCKPLGFQEISTSLKKNTPWYLLIRFPFFCGRLQKRQSSDEFYKNTVFWQGEYHGLSIYACGNMNNLLHGPKFLEHPLWDPSGDESAAQLFCGTYFPEDEHFEVKQERLDELFMNLRTSIHDGTRRGEREGKHTGWRDMLLRCDYVDRKEKTGEMRIFGSPVCENVKKNSNTQNKHFFCRLNWGFFLSY